MANRGRTSDRVNVSCRGARWNNVVAAHKAACPTGASPVMRIDYYSSSDNRRRSVATPAVKARSYKSWPQPGKPRRGPQQESELCSLVTPPGLLGKGPKPAVAESVHV